MTAHKYRVSRDVTAVEIEVLERVASLTPAPELQAAIREAQHAYSSYEPADQIEAAIVAAARLIRFANDQAAALHRVTS